MFSTKIFRNLFATNTNMILHINKAHSNFQISYQYAVLDLFSQTISTNGFTKMYVMFNETYLNQQRTSHS